MEKESLLSLWSTEFRGVADGNLEAQLEEQWSRKENGEQSMPTSSPGPVSQQELEKGAEKWTRAERARDSAELQVDDLVESDKNRQSCALP